MLCPIAVARLSAGGPPRLGREGSQALPAGRPRGAPPTSRQEAPSLPHSLDDGLHGATRGGVPRAEG
jgi:hypothetical protein